MTKLDYIILGNGLAGASIAVQLMKLDKKILVVDKASTATASRVAAGLFNPITGRKMVKSWLADKLFPYLHSFYPEIETLTNSKFFFPLPVYRPFISIGEQNEWMAKSIEPAFSTYIQKVYTSSSVPGVNDRYGGILLKHTGYLDTISYLDAVRRWIERDGTYVDEAIREEDIIIEKEKIIYKHFEAEKLIVCNGALDNKLFKWLPIRPLKGETLRIQSDHGQKVIINRGVYLVPGLSSGEWRVGATYDHEDHSPGPTEKARVELMEKTRELITFPFNIVQQEYGFRPTAPDRRPILGRHPALDRVFTLNGMGTKGVSLAPYFSEILVRFVENGEPINKEVDIERYKLLYWTSPR